MERKVGAILLLAAIVTAMLVNWNFANQKPAHTQIIPQTIQSLSSVSRPSTVTLPASIAVITVTSSDTIVRSSTFETTISSETASELHLLAYEWEEQACGGQGSDCLQFTVTNSGNITISVLAISLTTYDALGRPIPNGEAVGGLSQLVYPNYQTGFSIPVQSPYGPNNSCLSSNPPYALEVVAYIGATRETFLFTIYCAPSGVWISVS